MLVFWDVDTQVDFMLPHGKLYVQGAETIIPNLARLTEFAHTNGVRIVASSDDHEDDHEEISLEPDFQKTFPPHCMRGTRGQDLIPETTLQEPVIIEPDAVAVELEGHSGDVLFHKHYFDVFTNPHVGPTIEALGITEVVLYGVALDVCNRFAVEGLLERFPHIGLTVVTDAVRALDPERGEALLQNWAERGVALRTTDAVV